MRVLAIQAILAEVPPIFEEPPAPLPVVRTIAVREDQTLEQLHEALRLAFDWADPHLYSFWLGGEREGTQYSAPFDLEERGAESARVPLTSLKLHKGSGLAYLFDFGDEWRLSLKVVDTWPDDGDASYPMLVEAEGISPPQYPAWSE